MNRGTISHHIIVILSYGLLLCGIPSPSEVLSQPIENPPLGPEWEFVSQSDSATSFINLKTIRASGPFIKAWGIRNTDGTIRGKTYRSTKWMDEYDCTREESRTLTETAHSEPFSNGSIVYSSDRPSSWRPVPPGSVGERLLTFACGIHALQTVNPEKWTKITGNEQTVFYTSPGTRQRSGKMVKMLVLYDYLEPIDHDNGVVARSGKDLQEFDCANRLTRTTTHYARYSEGMGKGTIVFVGTFSDPNNSTWRDVKKGTYGEDVWAFACSQK